MSKAKGALHKGGQNCMPFHTAQESFDVTPGVIATGERRYIGQRRQPRLCLADLVEQDDRVELRVHGLRG